MIRALSLVLLALPAFAARMAAPLSLPRALPAPSAAMAPAWTGGATGFESMALSPARELSPAFSPALEAYHRPAIQGSLELMPVEFIAPAAAESARAAVDEGDAAFDGSRPPATRRDESVVDDYHGTKVKDPYRWLEDADSAETKAWVEAQNRHTRRLLDSIPGRDAIAERVKSLINYGRSSVPFKAGERWIYYKNSGLQNQDVLYKADALNGPAEVLLDPNALSADGTAALSGTAFSRDGRLMAYGVSRNGSDWSEWRVKDVATGRDLPDAIKWTKTGSPAWSRDGKGFYYTRFPEPKPGDERTGANRDAKVYYHRLGDPQEKDELIYARPDRPDWGLWAAPIQGGKLLIYQFEGTEPKNRLFVKDLKKKDAEPRPVFGDFDAQYHVIGSEKGTLYVYTTKDAPRGRVLAVDLKDPRPERWRELIPQAPGRDVLESVVRSRDGFVVTWMRDAHHLVTIHDEAGKLLREAALPGIGSVGGYVPTGAHGGYLMYSSYNHPRTVFHLNQETGKLRAHSRPALDFDPSKFEVKQVFYPSKDGVKVPMFIVHKKGLKLDGANPTYLYGYGGFNVSLNPGYSTTLASWLEMGGVYAVANIRGGGEYGQEWHDAGRRDKKQNSFDDFIAAAERLIQDGYTSPAKLAIGGGSNGGLLVGAVMTQRPELFAAAIPEVGVLDMLRFHLFTVGKGWKSDYGSSETKAGFDTLIKYSPLHNVRPGTRYPATMVMTGDHDDRVVPAHSHKFTAALQAAQAGPNPIVTRVETNAGHGAGTPIAKVIQEIADKWAFLKKALGMGTSAGRPSV